MNIALYLVLVITAIVATFFVVTAGARGSIGGVGLTNRIGIIVSAVVLVLWGIIAMSSFNVVTYSGGSEFSQSYEFMAWLAVGGGAIGLYSLFQASLREIEETGGI